MSSSSSQIDLEHQSGNPSSNGRSLLRSNSLNNVLSYVYSWLFTAIFLRSHRQGGRGAEGSSDVEMGVEGVEALQLQATAAADPNNTIVVDDGSTQVAENLISFGLTSSIHAATGRGPPSYVSEEGRPILSTQFIGQQVVGIWIVPTAVGAISGLIQVSVGSPAANSDQKLLTYFCSGISLATVILGMVLFVLSAMQWINNQRKDLIMRLIVVVALGSTFVNICVLMTFICILVQSKPHE